MAPDSLIYRPLRTGAHHAVQGNVPIPFIRKGSYVFAKEAQGPTYHSWLIYR
jgi:hypothetical protein